MKILIEQRPAPDNSVQLGTVESGQIVRHPLTRRMAAEGWPDNGEPDYWIRCHSKSPDNKDVCLASLFDGHLVWLEPSTQVTVHDGSLTIDSTPLIKNHERTNDYDAARSLH